MALISPAARQSFDHLFCAAVRANIAVQPGDGVEVLPADASGGKSELESEVKSGHRGGHRSDHKADHKSNHKSEPKRTLVMLTCASLRFKLVAVFQVVDEPLARAYFGNGGAATDPMEVLCERGNLCCGAMNRELLPYVPHVGLSTPSMLSGVASQVLASLQGEQVSQFAIRINGDHVLDVALCMRGQAAVDFVADIRAAAVETGELELL